MPSVQAIPLAGSNLRPTVYDENNWLQHPNPQFVDTYGGRGIVGPGGAVTPVQVPEWASWTGMSPETFAPWWQDIRPEDRPEARAGLEFTGSELGRRAEAREAALTTLGGASGRVSGLIEGFDEDPLRRRIGEALEQRTQDDYRVVTEQEEMQRMLELGRTNNRLVEQARLRAAARGQVYTPASMERTGAIRAAGEAGVAGVRTDIAGENERARIAALDALGGHVDRGAEIRTGMVNMLNWIDTQIADIEQGVDTVPFDANAFAMMGVAFDRYDDAMENWREGQAAGEAALEPNLMDIVTDLGIAFPGLIAQGAGAIGNLLF